LKNHQR